MHCTLSKLIYTPVCVEKPDSSGPQWGQGYVAVSYLLDINNQKASEVPKDLIFSIS